MRDTLVTIGFGHGRRARLSSPKTLTGQRWDVKA